jgi:hypothetical protein
MHQNVHQETQRIILSAPSALFVTVCLHESDRARLLLDDFKHCHNQSPFSV